MFLKAQGFTAIVLLVAYCEGVVNERLVNKRRAQKKARKTFEESHTAAFDSYGRVIRYGMDVDEVSCEEASEKWKCTVTEFSRRMYLTDAEKLISQQVKADKQEELDGQFGQTGSESTLAKVRVQKEQKSRCAVFNEWLAVFEKDPKQFFNSYLGKNYEDYAALRRLAMGSTKNTKKAKKLKRHISLNVHGDKLPPYCNNANMKSFMTEVLTNVEELVDCVATPHTCSAAGDL